MKASELIVGWLVLMGILAFAVGFDPQTMLAIVVALLAAIGAFGIWFAIADRQAKRDDDQAQQRADDDGFAQRREPEDLGRWPFTREDKTP